MNLFALLKEIFILLVVAQVLIFIIPRPIRFCCRKAFGGVYGIGRAGFGYGYRKQQEYFNNSKEKAQELKAEKSTTKSKDVDKDVITLTTQQIEDIVKEAVKKEMYSINNKPTKPFYRIFKKETAKDRVGSLVKKELENYYNTPMISIWDII